MNECCNSETHVNNGAEPGTFDLAVIGAGSAGFSAAITAAEAGARVILIGQGTIGGTCVNTGCIPSKALIRAAEAVHGARHAMRFAGIAASARLTDWGAVIGQKQQLVEELRRGKYSDILPAYDTIRYVQGRAVFAANGHLEVDGRRIRAAKIIIATGSRPALPSITGIGTVPFLTSTTALELPELPASLLIIGAGYIGVELAQLFARFGVRVTLVSRHGLLPEAEPEISDALTGFFTGEGIRVVSGISYERIGHSDDGIVLHVNGEQGKQVFLAERVLIATGRRPNSDGMNLEAAGIDTSAAGGITVDAHMRTSREDVFAAGDVTGRDPFVYMAAYGARIAAENAVTGAGLAYDNTVMPAVVFTDPQVASVGLGEAAARAGGTPVRTSVLPLASVPRALAARDTRGLIKLVADAGNGRLLGAHIIAPEGADTVQSAALAIRAAMTCAELGAMVFPYLTTVEGLKLAAQTFDRDVSKLSCCAG